MMAHPWAVAPIRGSIVVVRGERLLLVCGFDLPRLRLPVLDFLRLVEERRPRVQFRAVQFLDGHTALAVRRDEDGHAVRELGEQTFDFDRLTFLAGNTHPALYSSSA